MIWTKGTAEKMSDFEEALQRFDRACYHAGYSTATRDKACADGLKCARHGHDGRSFGGCPHEHCCSQGALQDLGLSGCTSSSKCSQCQGDCDRDSDCDAGLHCFQRDRSSQVVPGCPAGGSGDVESHDYCSWRVAEATQFDGWCRDDNDQEHMISDFEAFYVDECKQACGSKTYCTAYAWDGASRMGHCALYRLGPYTKGNGRG